MLRTYVRGGIRIAVGTRPPSPKLQGKLSTPVPFSSHTTIQAPARIKQAKGGRRTTLPQTPKRS